MTIHFVFDIRVRLHHIDDHIEGTHAFRTDDGLIDIEVDSVRNDFGIGEFLTDHVHITPFRNPEVLEHKGCRHTADTSYFDIAHITAAAVRHDHDAVLVHVAFDLKALFDHG